MYIYSHSLNTKKKISWKNKKQTRDSNQDQVKVSHQQSGDPTDWVTMLKLEKLASLSITINRLASFVVCMHACNWRLWRAVMYVKVFSADVNIHNCSRIIYVHNFWCSSLQQKYVNLKLFIIVWILHYWGCIFRYFAWIIRFVANVECNYVQQY